MVNYCRIMRCDADSSLPCLPDEMIEQILSNLSPVELIASGWHRVNSEFGNMIVHLIRKTSQYNVCSDRHLYEFFRSTFLLDDISTLSSHSKLLKLLVTKLLCYVNELTIPVGLFAHILSIVENDDSHSELLTLQKLNLLIGQEFGRLSLAKHFDHLTTARKLCGSHKLREVHLDIRIDDQELITCCGLREMVRFLMEITDEKTLWNVTLRDFTLMGQGWFGPSDLPKYRNRAFICYVRTILDLGIVVNRLSFVDERKSSPYMMIMAGSKHRSIYMYPEYKKCNSLELFYDIGLVAPGFAHENDRFNQLEQIVVEQSHVLYKSDLLDYLRNAPNLTNMQVRVPCSWQQRVRSCARGCFLNPDYACFREDGWACIVEKLPKVAFSLA